MSIQDIIQDQIQINKVAAMIGIKYVLGLDNGIEFAFKAKAKNRANVIRIVYDEEYDLYDIHYIRVQNKKDPVLGISMPEANEISVEEGVYGEDLIRLMQDETGLSFCL